MGSKITFLSGIKQNAIKTNLDAFMEGVLKSLETLHPEKKAHLKVRLVLEEIILNIINHAYGKKKGMIHVQCFKKPNHIFCIKITDRGIPFDITLYDVEDVKEDLMSRPIGGLGIPLILNTVNKIHYKREDHKNVLTVEMLVG